MTKRTPTHSTPGLAHSSERTVQQLIRLLDESRASTHLRTSEHFDRALGIWLAALQHAKLATWLDACAGMEKALIPLQNGIGASHRGGAAELP